MMSSISSWWSRFSRDCQGVAPSTPDNNENNSAPSPSPYAPLVGILLECGTTIGTCFLATSTLKYLLYPSREEEGTNDSLPCSRLLWSDYVSGEQPTLYSLSRISSMLL
jgi:hypothetical protein